METENGQVGEVVMERSSGVVSARSGDLPAAGISDRPLFMHSEAADRAGRPGVALRLITPADEDFLAMLYTSTRAEEMTLTGWPEAFQARFCAQQFAAQTAHYQTHFSDAQFCVVERDGTPVGRLIVLRSTSSLHVIDISLLPAARGQGIGSLLLADLLAEARRTGKTVGLMVEKMNRARQLYARLGFQVVADEGISWRMEWRDARAVTVSPQDSPRTSPPRPLTILSPTSDSYLPSTYPFDRPDGPRVPSAAAALH